MKAIVCTAYGSPEVLKLQEVDKPVPKKEEILVKIVATAVNSGDVRVRSLDVKGFMKLLMRIVLGFNKPRKQVLGTVFSGVVESKGGVVTNFKEGDKVFGMTGFQFGAYAEYMAISQKSNVIKMPRNATFEEATAIVFGGQSAIHFLEKAQIDKRSAQEVLIVGSTGSVGSASVQIANYYDANVTAVCSSNGERLMNELGVKNYVFYDKQDFTKLSAKFDVIFDAVGKTNKQECKELLADGGIYVSVNKGFASETVGQLEQLKTLFEQGELKAVIDKTFPMDGIVDAHRYVDTGRKKGNVVLTIAK